MKVKRDESGQRDRGRGHRPDSNPGACSPINMKLHI